MTIQKAREKSTLKISWGKRGGGDIQRISQRSEGCFQRQQSYLSDSGWSSFSFPWFLLIRFTFLFRNRGAFSYQMKENQVRLKNTNIHIILLSNLPFCFHLATFCSKYIICMLNSRSYCFIIFLRMFLSFRPYSFSYWSFYFSHISIW